MILGHEHLGPYEMADNDEPEPIAPYCDGPGHRLDFDAAGRLVRVDDCPACERDGVRNHRTFRLPEGIDL